MSQSGFAGILRDPRLSGFMGMDTEQFEPGLIQPGILLCSLCILLWSLCIYKEFRHIILSVEAIWSIPRARVTEYRDNTIYSLSRIRCIAPWSNGFAT